MFKQRTESMSIKDFMNRDYKMKDNNKLALSGILPLALVPFATSSSAAAQSPEAVTVMASSDMYVKMQTAFEPLIILVQSLAYPIATVVVLGGAIMVMIGMKEKGYSLMMSAGMGYVLVNMTPMVLNILVDAMKAV